MDVTNIRILRAINFDVCDSITKRAISYCNG
jgi:hypothetical protein